MNKIIGYLTISFIIGLGAGIIAFDVFEGGVLGMEDNTFPVSLTTAIAAILVWLDMSDSDKSYDFS